MAKTAEKIRWYRRANAMTQEELAQKARIAQSTLSMIESGEREHPRPSTLKKLADALGVEPIDLMDDPDWIIRRSAEHEL